MTRFYQLNERYHALDAATRRLILILVALLLLMLTLYSALSSHLAYLNKRKLSREHTLQELLVLRQRYQEAAADAQQLANRMASVTTSDSPASIIEQSGIIPKAGVQSKPLPRQDRGALIEEGAEVTLSGLTLNDTVNLLHYLEHGSKPVAIRKVAIRSRFNDPSKLDLTLQIALFRAATQTKP
jgi:general secretion pathway protein M